MFDRVSSNIGRHDLQTQSQQHAVYNFFKNQPTDRLRREDTINININITVSLSHWAIYAFKLCPCGEAADNGTDVLLLAIL